MKPRHETATDFLGAFLLAMCVFTPVALWWGGIL